MKINDFEVLWITMAVVRSCGRTFARSFECTGKQTAARTENRAAGRWDQGDGQKQVTRPCLGVQGLVWCVSPCTVIAVPRSSSCGKYPSGGECREAAEGAAMSPLALRTCERSERRNHGRGCAGGPKGQGRRGRIPMIYRFEAATTGRLSDSYYRFVRQNGRGFRGSHATKWP